MGIFCFGFVIFFVTKMYEPVAPNVPKEITVKIPSNGHGFFSNRETAFGYSTINAAVFGQLLQFDEVGNLKPGVIESWEYLRKSNCYILRLRKNLRYHDGTKPTAQHLAFSLIRGLFSKEKSYYRTFLQGVIGADKPLAGTKYSESAVAGVKSLENGEVQVCHKHPYPTFLYNLTNPYLALVKPEQFKKDPLVFSDKPIGAGEFYVSDSKDWKSQTIELVRVDKSHEKKKETREKPKIVIATSEAVDSSADLILFSKEPVQGNKKSVINKSRTVLYVAFNFQSQLGRNLKFRRYVQSVVSRYKWFDSAKEKPLRNSLPVSSMDRFHTPIKVLKDDFAYKGKNKSFDILIPTETPPSLVAHLSAEFSKSGVRVNFKPRTVKNKFWDSTKKDEPIKLVTFFLNSIEPTHFMAFFLSGSSLAPYTSSDRKLLEMHELVLKSSSIEEKKKNLTEYKKYFLKNVFAVPVYELKRFHHFKPETLSNIKINAAMTFDLNSLEFSR